MEATNTPTRRIEHTNTPTRRIEHTNTPTRRIEHTNTPTRRIEHTNTPTRTREVERTRTPTRTPEGGTGNATATPTRTKTPKATRTPSDCRCDCEYDKKITVHDLLRVVRILLGTASIDECPKLAAQTDHVTLQDLVRAVGQALEGTCK